MAELKTLIRKRGINKARLTTFTKHVKILTKASLTRAQVIDLEQRIADIEALLVEFREVQSQIEILIEDDIIDEQLKERDTFENDCFVSLALAKSLLPVRNSGITVQEDLASHTSHPCQNQNGLRLPTINLPVFEGKIENWLEFRDTYISLIHENESINAIQKFHYLRAALTGNAAQVVNSLEFSASNYHVAWSTLLDRFNNTRLLVNNHVQALFSLENITKESAGKFRNLLDTVTKHLRSLKQLDEPTEHWDTLLIHMIVKRLDAVTIREWEEFKFDKEKPTLDDLKGFLKGKADLLESIFNNHKDQLKVIHKPKPQVNSFTHHQGPTRGFFAVNLSCQLCKSNHALYQCGDFLKLDHSDRYKKVKELNLCLNCFKPGHNSHHCFNGSCRKCGKKHNTALHNNTYVVRQFQAPSANQVEQRSRNVVEETHSNSSNPSDVEVSVANSRQGGSMPQARALHSHNEKHVLLSTAYVDLLDTQGKAHRARAILDSGSTSTFMTDELCRRLALKLENTSIKVSGIGNVESTIKNKCRVNLNSTINSFKTTVNCYVVPLITSDVPSVRVNDVNSKIPERLVLADPHYYIPGKVDLLIGADLFWQLMCGEQVALGKGLPILQKTLLGWIVSGPIFSNSHSNVKCNFNNRCNFNQDVNSDTAIQNTLAKFWEIEEVENIQLLSGDEIDCENNFVSNTTRDSNGRFVVKLPLKGSTSLLGHSYTQAERRFLNLEKRLQKQPELKEQYSQFMKEYQDMGHMSLVTNNKLSDDVKDAYYIPHHGVFKESSTTTKLRVVFDASSPTSSGYSLNDLQLVGPTIQDDILSIILRFRMHTIVISADIQKMYRQVLIHEDHRPLQKILWRPSPHENLQTFQLNTVTYGTTSGSFLAIRCIKQLANESRELFPDIARIIESDFYVDDLLSGASTPQQALQISNKIFEILKGGCFELRKWRSNSLEVFNQLAGSSTSDTVEFCSDAKTLGLIWQSTSDTLRFNINLVEQRRITKRTILSIVAQIFDPLGLVSPCTILAKIILQKLWLLKIAWDDEVPIDVLSSWLKLNADLKNLNQLDIKRHAILADTINLQLHFFSDASEVAYACCVYLKSTDKFGNVSVRLLCAKAKVAPLKSLTIPRLELCGALLASRLATKVFDSFKFIEHNDCFFWTDSTIVLGWLNTPPNQLKTFVSNRVAEIQQATSNYKWSHVPGKDNPADLASRGVYPSVLIDSDLYWNGPSWLKKENSHWPKLVKKEIEIPELRVHSHIVSLIQKTNYFSLNRFSKLTHLIRSVAYMYRFKNNCLSKGNRISGRLSVTELNYALKILIKNSQMESFSKDYEDLANDRNVHKSSKILSLNPFIDSDGIIRVGGRLRNSKLPYQTKHPILVASNHRITELLFNYEHLRLCHAGPQLLLSSIREKYWPIAGRNAAKKAVRRCVICTRYNPKPINQIMGDLPAARFQSNHPFIISGVDYAGPYMIKNIKGRNPKVSKCWLCLFVCFTTRAVHLELVTDLSTDAFLMAFRRFVARRGKPTHIYSDNGGGFVKANTELKQLANFFIHEGDKVTESIANEGVQWHFIPPHSPHFGGIWEAGIKSSKTHLKRVLGTILFTFEEFYTLLVQIESILNSRPLFKASSDPSDLQPISPAHFLVGRQLTSLPDPDLAHIQINKLSRLQHIQQMQQHFWKRWHKEYISELQQRCKWKTSQSKLTIGDIVIIKEDNLPPKHWKLGRVLQVFPGKDGVSRVAEIQTSTGIIKRGCVKLCKLPIATSDSCDENK